LHVENLVCYKPNHYLIVLLHIFQFLVLSCFLCYNLCVLDKPASPKDFKVTATHKDSVELSWNIPEYDGGSPITQYVIEKQDLSRGTWSAAGKTRPSATEFTVGKLTEGKEYLFRIYAENEVGVSSPVEIKKPVTAKSPYSKFKQYSSLVY